MQLLYMNLLFNTILCFTKETAVVTNYALLMHAVVSIPILGVSHTVTTNYLEV